MTLAKWNGQIYEDDEDDELLMNVAETGKGKFLLTESRKRTLCKWIRRYIRYWYREVKPASYWTFQSEFLTPLCG
jgi:hypothetical protein